MAKKLLLLFSLLLVLTVSGNAQSLNLSNVARVTAYTVAALPASGNWTGRIVWVTDATDAGTLGAGGGSAIAFCIWDGDSWEVTGGGSGGGGTDDQTAAEVPFTPYSTLAATDVQAAIQEVLDEATSGVTSVNGNSGPSVTLDADDISDAATTNKFVTAAHLTILGNTSGTNTGDQTTVSGNAGTATALAANGANCTAGSGAGGVDASGAAEDCVDFITSAEAPVQSVNSATGTVVLDADDISDAATTNKFVTAADVTNLGNLSGTNTGDQTTVSGNAGTATALAANGANCTAGQGAGGVNASGAAEDCVDFITSAEAPVQSVNSATGAVVLDADDISDAATTNKFTDAAGLAVIAATSGTNTGDQTTITGNAGTATALAANGTNCTAGSFPLGVDASGNVEGCTVSGSGADALGTADPGANGVMVRTALNTTVARTITGTANEVEVTNGDGVAGAPVIGLPTSITVNVTGALTGNADTSTALAANPADCSAGIFATTIAANGDLTCAAVAYADVTGTPTLRYQVIDDEDTPLTVRGTLNFEGAGVTCADDTDQTTCTIAGGGSSINVEENNVEVIAAANLTGIDFLGVDFDVTDASNEADVAIAAAITRDSEVPGLETNNLSTVTWVNVPDANITASSVTQHEAALEAVLDLQDMQGAIIDSQVPNTITIDLATVATTANAGDSATAFFSSGEIEDARLPTGLTRDAEWDTLAEINAATTDDDAAGLAAAQTFATGTKTVTAKFDFGGGTLEIPNGTTLPASCAVGDQFMDTDATTGQRLYLCESTNTWALQGDGAGGGSGNMNQAVANDTDNTISVSVGTSGTAFEKTPNTIDPSTGDTVIAGTLSVGSGATEITIEEISAISDPGVAAKQNFGIDSDTDRLASRPNGGTQVTYVALADIDTAAEINTLTTDTDFLLLSSQNAGTNYTADLEEEGQINATAVTGNAAANGVIVGTGANAAAYSTLPSCSNATTSKLLYNNSTQAFTCGTDQDGGGGGSSGGGGATNYEESFSAQTSVTLAGTEHLFAHAKLVVQCYDDASPKAVLVPAGVTVNTTSYDVTVTFAVSESGSCSVAGGGIGANENYEEAFTAQTSVTVTGVEHGFGHDRLIVAVYDNASPKALMIPAAVTIDPTSFDVVVTFGVSDTGSIVVMGSSTDAGGGSLTVEESDASPTVSSVDTIQFNQAEGFTVTDETGGQVQVGLTLTDALIPNDITIDLATVATTANAGDSATSFFSTGTLEDALLSANVVREDIANTWGAFAQNFSAATVTLPTSITLTTPTISSTGFTNAQHAHTGATSGGTLGTDSVSSAAITDGVVAPADMATAAKEECVTFELPDPATGDSLDYHFRVPTASTLTRMECAVRAGTSVTMNLYERTLATITSGGSTTNLVTTSPVCVPGGDTETTFSDSAMASGAYVTFVISAVSGAVEHLTAAVCYTRN